MDLRCLPRTAVLPATGRSRHLEITTSHGAAAAEEGPPSALDEAHQAAGGLSRTALGSLTMLRTEGRVTMIDGILAGQSC
jgi:hypothetical protein